ncbi:hypothetical protein [Streptomyces mirabilis]|uniref:hypothetical protein n=1 Tax=Streptomyces mirabilis TaxID=68239 RepID=UPI0036937AC5
MSSLTKRMCIAITSVVVAGGAVVGVGGTASAAVPEHVQCPAVGVAADNHRSGGGDGRNWDRSDDRRSGRDHGYCRDGGHAYGSDRDRDCDAPGGQRQNVPLQAETALTGCLSPAATLSVAILRLAH